MIDKILDNLYIRDSKEYVIGKTRNWSYKQLYFHILHANSYFIKNNIKKVLISKNQGFYAYTLMISVYLSGGTFCVINPDVPNNRKEYYIKQFEPELIIYEDGDPICTYNDAKACSAERFFEEVNFDRYDKILKGFDNKILYVAFTSGSTGLPKGCKVKRESVEKLCLWAVKEFGIQENDIIGQFTPLYFDLSMLDIFGTLITRATLVPFESISEKLRPGNMIRKYQISVLNVVPHVIDILSVTHQLEYSYLQSLKVLRLGGDKLYTSQLERLFSIVPELKVVVTYGPTETTMFCMCQTLQINNYKSYCTTLVTMGKPVPGWNVKLSDIDSEGIGEIIIFGDYIGEGYLSNDENNCFRTEVINKVKQKVYYTGDYACYKDGNLYFMGRRDSQIKINGIRIDLSEIDYVMRDIGCSNSMSILYNNIIICFYIPINKNIQEEFIKNELITRIPSYAIPSFFVCLDKIPYNSNGKIDKQALNQLAEVRVNENR